MLKEGNLYIEIDNMYKKMMVNFEDKGILRGIESAYYRMQALEQVYEELNIRKDTIFIDEKI